MNEIDKVRTWLAKFGGFPKDIQVDYTSEIPQNTGLFPNGITELTRKEDVLGNITITNQLNFGLYNVMEKSPEANEQATTNASWVMDFQKWVQEQSILRLAPTFGNYNTTKETIRAQNGTFYGSKDVGVGIYMVLLSVTYQNYYGA